MKVIVAIDSLKGSLSSLEAGKAVEDLSLIHIFSVATALIPFLQNDDANRALMGSNMQRQAVPLLTTEAPVVGTGMETKTAVDSGVCVVAKKSGTIEKSESNQITVKNDDGTRDVYKLTKFSRSNQSNCYNQRPIAVSYTHLDVYKRQILSCVSS